MNNKTLKSKLKKNRFLLVIGVIAIAILTVILGIPALREEHARASMSGYLKNKYKQEFVVTKPALEGGGLGVDGVWNATAHPKSDESLSFDIIKSENKDSFADQYTALVWSQRETDSLNKMVRSDTAKWRINILVNIYLSEPFSDRELPDSGNMKNILQQDYGLSYTVNIKYSGVSSDSLGDTVSDAKRITDIIQKDRGVKNFNVDYLIEMNDGSVKKCSGKYYKQFDFSLDSITRCLN